MPVEAWCSSRDFVRSSPSKPINAMETERYLCSMSFHKIEEPPVLALFSSITRAKMQGAPRTNTSRNVLTPFGLNRVRRNDLRKGSTQRKVRGYWYEAVLSHESWRGNRSSLASWEGRERPWGDMNPLHVRFGRPCRFIPFYEEIVIGIRTEDRKAQMSSDPTTRND